jgi:hypothetical protein
MLVRVSLRGKTSTQNAEKAIVADKAEVDKEEIQILQILEYPVSPPSYDIVEPILPYRLDNILSKVRHGSVLTGIPLSPVSSSSTVDLNSFCGITENPFIFMITYVCVCEGER